VRKWTATTLVVVALGLGASSALASEWVDLASRKVKKHFEDEKTQVNVAKSILNCTHPTGDDPTFVSAETYTDADDDKVLLVVITIKWKGGLTGSKYKTSVTWRCKKGKHIDAVVSSDESIIPVSKSNKSKLDDYFSELAESFFPGHN
jgi:hypothetical protein